MRKEEEKEKTFSKLKPCIGFDVLLLNFLCLYCVSIYYGCLTKFPFILNAEDLSV